MGRKTQLCGWSADDCGNELPHGRKLQRYSDLLEALKVMLDQIDGDPLAIQFFDLRLVKRIKDLIEATR